jgi:hypothetical protein
MLWLHLLTWGERQLAPAPFSLATFLMNVSSVDVTIGEFYYSAATFRLLACWHLRGQVVGSFVVGLPIGRC